MTPWMAAALLGLLLAALELRRADRRHLGLRITAVLVAAAALGALARPPLLPAVFTQPDAAILITPGTDDGLRNRLRDSLPGVPIIIWPDSIAEIGALRLRMPELRHLHVAGWGLRESFWTGQDDLRVTFHPAPLPNGFHHLSWPEVVRLGDDVTVTGRIGGSGRSSVIWFERPEGGVDSVSLGAAPDSAIRFLATPGAEGRSEYLLGVDRSATDTLRITVLPAKPPAILILEGSPSFETTFLRRWLADQGATIGIRTRLSRDQYRVDRINLPGVGLTRVTDDLLDRFDLLVIDGATIAALTGPERAALERAIGERGLGVLLMPDSLARRDARLFPFELPSVGDLDDRLVRPRWTGQRAGVTMPVPALPEEIRPAAGQRPQMRDPVGRIVAATVPWGMGLIGTSLITAPSRWLIEDETAAFADYWRAVIAALARDRSDRWSVAADGPVVVDLPVALALGTRDTMPEAIVTRPDGTVDTLGMAADPAEPGRWWGRYWPVERGWHLLTNRGGESYAVYVDVMRESAREATARLAATARRAAAGAREYDVAPVPFRRPLPPLIPFLVFLSALGMLWGEGRSGREPRLP